MNGRQRINRVLAGESSPHPPVMPIVHTALGRVQGVLLGDYFRDARIMADVIADGARQFGWDGVQMTMGVAGEAEALGAAVEQPADGATLVKSHPLQEGLHGIARLRELDAAAGGRMPLYHAAVANVVDRIGGEVFVLSTLRGPLNIASQLRGVEDVLVDMIENPEAVEQILDFTTDVAIQCSKASLDAGAHGLMFGEATCSPNFISPAMYRRFVLPRHRRLVEATRRMGWRHVGLHVCGNLLPILEDLISTGVNLLDVDYQVPAGEAIVRTAGRIALRGNLDPVRDLLNATAEQVSTKTASLLVEVRGHRWIISSGCDIPPGTPADNLAALVQAARETTDA